MIKNKTYYLKKTFLIASVSAIVFGASLVVHASVLIQSSPVSGLAAYWTFDAKDINWGSNLVTDASGNGNTGTLVSMTAANNQVAGKRAQAVFLDGNVDSISLASNPIASVSSPSSVCAWGNTNNIAASTGGYNQTILNLYTNNNNGIHMGNVVSSGKFFASYRSGGTYYGAESTSQVFSNNAWVHVCYVWNGTGITLYANGVSVASTTNTDSAGTVNTIGAHDDVGDGTWSGSIDDIRVYSRALSATEIQQIYKSGALVFNTAAGRRVDLQKSTPNFMSSGLVGYWSFNNQDINWSTGKLIDRSGQGNDGQITNMSTTSSPVMGKMGQAFSFDGVNDYVATNSAVTFSANFTISLWAKTTTSDTSANFVGVEDTGSSGAVAIFANTDSSPFASAGKTFFQVRDDAGGVRNVSISNSSVYDGNWHNIVLTRSGASTSVYIDGISETVTVGLDNLGTASIVTDFPLMFGARNYHGSSNNNLSSYLDDIRIYNRALSASEVRQLYNQGR